MSVDISQRSFQERTAYPKAYEWTAPVSRTAAPVASVSQSTPRTSLAMVDAYA